MQILISKQQVLVTRTVVLNLTDPPIQEMHARFSLVPLEYLFD